MYCPCLYILSAWMHLLFTTTILVEKNHSAIRWPAIRCPFQKLTLNRQIAGYGCIHLKHIFTSSEMRNSMHRDEQIFHIGKEWFYVRLEAARCYEWQRWFQLSFQNRKKKNRKCIHTMSETLTTFWVCM